MEKTSICFEIPGEISGEPRAIVLAIGQNFNGTIKTHNKCCLNQEEKLKFRENLLPFCSASFPQVVPLCT